MAWICTDCGEEEPRGASRMHWPSPPGTVETRQHAACAEKEKRGRCEWIDAGKLRELSRRFVDHDTDCYFMGHMCWEAGNEATACSCGLYDLVGPIYDEDLRRLEGED